MLLLSWVVVVGVIRRSINGGAQLLVFRGVS